MGRGSKTPGILDVVESPELRPAYDAMMTGFATGRSILLLVGPDGALPLLSPEKAGQALAKEVADQLVGDPMLVDELTRSLSENPSKQWR
jgi:hypothetical protein